MNTGFSIMSVPHIVTLLIIIALCICVAFIYRQISEKARNIFGLIIGIIVVALDLVHYVVYYQMGELSVFAIPLHLCALALYMCLLHSIFCPDWKGQGGTESRDIPRDSRTGPGSTGRTEGRGISRAQWTRRGSTGRTEGRGIPRADWMGQVLYDLCLPGVWCALLFPDWVRYPLLSYPSLHSFATHALVSIYVVMQLSTRRIQPRLSAIWKPILFLCVTVPAAAIANNALGTNFMFIAVPSPGSPLEFLSSLAGGSHALYLVFFGLLAIIVMTIMYIPFAIYNKNHR